MGRMEKINQLIRREISEMLQREIQDPRVEFVSITHVDTSPDLRFARVSISVLGDEKKMKEALEALNHARGYIRKNLGDRVRIRYIPEIEFVYDRSIEYGAKIEQKLKEIADERKQNFTSAEDE